MRYLVPFLLLAPFFVISANAQTKRVWTVEETLAERQPPSKIKKVHYCQGGAFKPCVCAKDVTKYAQYRPAVKECGNNAAIILSGKYLGSYSAVVRDFLNRDRFPVQGANNCSRYETDVLGLNKCSVFKAQDRFSIENMDGDADVHCLGASGYSKLFSKVTRMTIKLSDDPKSGNDPLARLCLVGPTKALN